MNLEPVKLDLQAMRRNLLRRETPQRVFFFEHGEGDQFKEKITSQFDLAANIPHSPSAPEYQWQREINIQRFLGHEIIRLWLPGAEYAVAGSKGTTWAEEHTGPIQNWDDIDRYPWPQPHNIDYSQLEWYETNLPDDMGVLHITKTWEVVRELLGFENFCIKMHEDPDLIREVVQRVGDFHMALTRALCDFRCVFCVYGADDFGYKTSTMIDPDTIKQMFLSWHKNMAQCAHDHGKLYFMHCCGKIDAIMDYLIDTVKIDAKHSFEDTIEPVTLAKQRWGARLSLLGGLDVDFVARAPEPDIRQRVRDVLEVCMPGGGYCLGLGNWVTDYIPVPNYLAILEEGRRFCR